MNHLELSWVGLKTKSLSFFAGFFSLKIAEWAWFEIIKASFLVSLATPSPIQQEIHHRSLAVSTFSEQKSRAVIVAESGEVAIEKRGSRGSFNLTLSSGWCILPS